MIYAHPAETETAGVVHPAIMAACSQDGHTTKNKKDTVGG